jgi:signal transduction histidine kinase
VLDRESRHVGAAATQVLVLQSGTTLFEAELPQGLSRPITVPNNSLVRVSGINLIQTDQWRKGRSFRLLLRDAGDLAVLNAPPRLTPEVLGRAVTVGSIIMLGAVTWIVVLRRRVAARTASLREANDHLKEEIAERHQAEAELRRAEGDLRSALEKERELSELKTNFVNVVSHEFRTPLSIILSSSEILDSYLETLAPGEREQHLHDIKECTRHMATLMEDVLVLGRVEAGKMQFRPVTLDVPGFCRRLMDEILSATNHQCPIEFSDQDVEESGRGDEGLLRHIFHNLLSNAIKYSPVGQAVTFRVHREADDAVFTVHDDGIGIPGEDLRRMFTAFHRGRNVGQLPGSGLGLVIVKRCVDLHQGHVRVESVEGTGTTVTVRLPLFAKTGHTELVHRAPATTSCS